MINDKISSTKIILAIVILIALGLVAYFVMPKNPSQVVVQSTSSPTITSQPTVTPVPSIDISDWKTYRSNKYGYEIKYPVSGSFIEISSGIKDANDKGYITSFSFGKDFAVDAIEITASKNSRNDKTINELIESRNNMGGLNVPEYAKKIQIDGKPAFEWVTYLQEPGSERIGAIALLFNGGDYYYIIKTGNQYTPGFTIDMEKIYNLFLSTFKFIK